MGTKSSGWCHCEKRKRHTDTRKKEEGRVTMEAEIRVMQLHAKERQVCQEPQEAVNRQGMILS